MEKATYRHDGPPRITLFTVINRNTGSGGHSALMINADERIIFDPAGTFKVGFVPERNDVLFGVTPRTEAAYIDYHARADWNVRIQELDVTLDTARMVARLAKDYGAVPKAQCSVSVTTILGQVPGMESIARTYFPKTLSREFGALPGVRERLVTDETAETWHNVIFQGRHARSPG